MITYKIQKYAGMAELADAHGSGPCDSNIMRVQVPFPAFNSDLIYILYVNEIKKH